MPDPTVLARSLNKKVRKVALARNALQLDSIPSHDAVEKYGHLEKEVTAPVLKGQVVDTRIKKMDTVQKKDEVKKAGEDARPCKFFLTKKGCRRGRGCKWGHDQKAGTTTRTLRLRSKEFDLDLHLLRLR